MADVVVHLLALLIEKPRKMRVMVMAGVVVLVWV